MRRETPIAAAILVTALAGCGTHSLDSKELSSSLRATASLAAETNLFIGYLQSGYAPPIFARAHADYLARELDDERRSLDTARVNAQLLSAFTFCREQQDELGVELRRLELALQDPEQLAQIRARIETIGASAAQVRAAQ
ncbi:MAG TPA: hypothetical protein VHC90_06325 [Bryobacteraceae bacterium]|nr:hypothetical protein [Bryobacteraceae bacterium]